MAGRSRSRATRSTCTSITCAASWVRTSSRRSAASAGGSPARQRRDETGRAWSLRNRLIVLLRGAGLRRLGREQRLAVSLRTSSRPASCSMPRWSKRRTPCSPPWLTKACARTTTTSSSSRQSTFTSSESSISCATAAAGSAMRRRVRRREALAAGEASGFTERVADGVAYRVYTLARAPTARGHPRRPAARRPRGARPHHGAAPAVARRRGRRACCRSASGSSCAA